MIFASFLAFQGPPHLPPEVVEIVKIGLATGVTIALGIPIVRALTRRLDSPMQRPPMTSPDTTDRLERIEQAVEAVAIEVERIAEAQRFTAKLMAEQAQEQRALPRADSAN